MKNIVLLLALVCAFACVAEEINLIPNPSGAEHFKKWYNPPHARITAADGVITIAANPDPKANAYQKAQITLSGKGVDIQEKKFELSFKYRTEKLDGSLQIAVREAFGKNSSYHGKILKKWDVSKEWKEVRYLFTTRKDASGLQLYIVGRYMKPGEKVELKELKVVAR